MHATFLILCACAAGSFAVPDEIGGVFSLSAKSQTDVSIGTEITAGNGQISGDATGSARGDVDAQVRGGGYLASNGKSIGINVGGNGKAGVNVQGSVHGEVGQNKDGTITAGANSTLSTTSNIGVSGHANVATGAEELRHIAEYENGRAIERSSKDLGTETDLGSLISVTGKVIEHFWLYFWLCIGGVIFIVCCCVFTVCGFYWKLVADIKSLKKEKAKMQDTMNASIKEHTVVHLTDWDKDKR